MADLVLQDLAQELQIKVPDAPLPYLTRVLRQAIQEFCEKSESYIFCFDGITAQANDPYYDIGLPSGTRISKVNRVSYDGVPLDATSEASLLLWTALFVLFSKIQNNCGETLLLLVYISKGLIWLLRVRNPKPN